MYRITATTDNQHVGESIAHIEKGNLLTFADGDVVSIDEAMFSEDRNTVIVSSENYQLKFIKE